jgi:aryl-alcohol dehydrogenase-like predicted oxidoreductase
MESVLASEDVDFVQLPYSVVDRAAEKRLLPAAKNAGAAVLVMRPFDEGGLFSRVRGKALPEWAGEHGCTSWASLALKFILSHPAVTCPIPATSSAAHLAENLEAGEGAMLDEAALRRVATLFD